MAALVSCVDEIVLLWTCNGLHSTNGDALGEATGVLLLTLRDEKGSLLADNERALLQLEVGFRARYIAHVNVLLLVIADAERSEAETTIVA